MALELSASAQQRQEKRRLHYRLPPISGTPPVMKELRRVNHDRTIRDQSIDFAKRLHVSCYYEWVVNMWNDSNPDNVFSGFEDNLDVDRRNQEHKKIIGQILRERLPQSYRKHTLSQARIADYSAVKDAIEEICKIDDFRPYTQHIYGCWAVRKLVDQHMDAVSRSYRKKESRAMEKRSLDSERDTLTATNLATRAAEAFELAHNTDVRQAVPDLAHSHRLERQQSEAESADNEISARTEMIEDAITADTGDSDSENSSHNPAQNLTEREGLLRRLQELDSMSQERVKNAHISKKSEKRRNSFFEESDYGLRQKKKRRQAQYNLLDISPNRTRVQNTTRNRPGAKPRAHRSTHRSNI